MPYIFAVSTLFALIAFHGKTPYSHLSSDNAIEKFQVSTTEQSYTSSIKHIILDKPIAISKEKFDYWLREKLQTPNGTSFDLLTEFEDRLGFTHYKFQQSHHGFPVVDGIFSIHTKKGSIHSASGEYYPMNLSSPKKLIEFDSAKKIALNESSISSNMLKTCSNSSQETCILVKNATQYYTHKVIVKNEIGDIHTWVFVNAMNGDIISMRNQIQHISVPGKASCFYHGEETIQVDSIAPDEFVLVDRTRGQGIFTQDLNLSFNVSDAVPFVDHDNIWDTETDFDNAALDVHWACGLMYDYMLESHGWDSYDNLGGAIMNYVHYGNRLNAIWNGSALLFGDGDGSLFNPLTAAEITGHELMHGYSSSMVRWNNSNRETAALNEAYSDIFSVIVEQAISPSTANYIIGDMITVTGEGLRDMAEPKSLEQPDTYEGEFWDPLALNAVANVFSHAFYLMVEGGEGVNDNGDDYSVSPVPLNEVADILFRALSVYMTPSSEFLDAREFGIQACKDLYGQCSYQEIQFTNACYAVGVGPAYGGPALPEILVDGEPITNNELDFNSMTPNAILWFWEFGDSSVSMEEMPKHAYEKNGTYQVIVTTRYSESCTLSDTLEITVDDITNSTTDFFGSDGMIAYPNPTTNYINIQFPFPLQVQAVRLITLKGSQINIGNVRRLTQRHRINLRHLSAGVYFIEVDFKSGQKARKRILIQ